MLPERFARLKEVLDRRQPDLTVVMDQVNKGHNLAAILRNCDAAGVLEAHAVPAEMGLTLSPETAAGSQKWVPVREHGDVEEALAWVRDRGFQVVAAHPAPEARDYREVDFTRPTALLVGAELHGVSPRALEGADLHVNIPMRGMVQSLNVSVATALLLYEAARQREAAGLYDRPRLDPEQYRRLLFEWAHPRVARLCRERGTPYPVLSPDGQLLGPIPGTIRNRS